jgi:hypothetical protein
MKHLPGLLLRVGLAALVVAALACSSSDDGAGSATPAAPSPPEAAGPGETVQQFYDRLNASDYDGAWSLYNAQAQRSLAEVGVSGSGLAEWATEETKRHTIQGVTIVNSSVFGDAATVRFEIRYRDGTSKRGTVDLRQEGGSWRLGLVS